ncbi:polysaccharide lyase family 8 super-sandwich domain-containing protein [Luteolibacter sp. LG18]|uniref:polysaccharide lyase family 8 super-sandwich domain-containing protein n=1 Tax=Luteolibacter sp. LG18 TaxID=2819286 RepID=UPI002B2D05FA|nr:chondroitinase [Luteolibacter sp. LG18]
MLRWLSLLWICVASVCPAAEADLDRAIAQFRNFQLGKAAAGMQDTNEGRPADAKVDRSIRSLKPDGSWPDIDYGGKARSAWQPAEHVGRLRAMVGSVAKNEGNRAETLAAVHRAFAFWIKADLQCPNWWYNNIGIPKELATCGLLLGKDLLPEEKRFLTEVLMPRSKIAMTGQNRQWLAGNTLMFGLLKRDEAVVGEASGVIWNEVQVTEKEGIQPDHSFHQHGPQQQFGNYGLAFAVEIGRWAIMLTRTPWALPATKLEAYRHFLLDGEAWICWRGVMDIGACGRQFRPGAPESKASTITSALGCAAEFDRDSAPAYQAAAKRNQPGAPNDLTGNRFFWRSDGMVQRNADWCATLKMSSNRVIGAEIVNDENLSGYHLGDGMLLLYRGGGEYRDIFPVWDWRKLPGTTCAQNDLPRLGHSAVPRDFIGGLSNGGQGLAVMDYARDGASARKAWFFNDTTVVCLGAAITGNGKENVVTTLEQSLLQGPPHGQQDGRPTTPVSGTLSGLEWIEHGGFRYSLLEKAPLTLASRPATGNWSRVFRNPGTPKADVTKPLFLLTLDHGSQPKNARYAYALSPAGEAPRMKLLANSDDLQAVQITPDLTGLAFWKAGTFKTPSGAPVTVGQPCVALLDTAKRELRVADPTQKLTSLQVTLGSAARTVDLPSGGRAGTAVVVK